MSGRCSGSDQKSRQFVVQIAFLDYAVVAVAVASHAVVDIDGDVVAACVVAVVVVEAPSEDVAAVVGSDVVVHRAQMWVDAAAVVPVDRKSHSLAEEMDLEDVALLVGVPPVVVVVAAAVVEGFPWAVADCDDRDAVVDAVEASDDWVADVDAVADVDNIPEHVVAAAVEEVEAVGAAVGVVEVVEAVACSSQPVGHQSAH